MTACDQCGTNSHINVVYLLDQQTVLKQTGPVRLSGLSGLVWLMSATAWQLMRDETPPMGMKTDAQQISPQLEGAEAQLRTHPGLSSPSCSYLQEDPPHTLWRQRLQTPGKTILEWY